MYDVARVTIQYQNLVFYSCKNRLAIWLFYCHPQRVNHVSMRCPNLTREVLDGRNEQPLTEWLILSLIQKFKLLRTWHLIPSVPGMRVAFTDISQQPCDLRRQSLITTFIVHNCSLSSQNSEKCWYLFGLPIIMISYWPESGSIKWTSQL